MSQKIEIPSKYTGQSQNSMKQFTLNKIMMQTSNGYSALVIDS